MKTCYIVKVVDQITSRGDRIVGAYESYSEANARAGREIENGAYLANVVDIPYYSESDIHNADGTTTPEETVKFAAVDLCVPNEVERILYYGDSSIRAHEIIECYREQKDVPCNIVIYDSEDNPDEVEAVYNRLFRC